MGHGTRHRSNLDLRTHLPHRARPVTGDPASVGRWFTYDVDEHPAQRRTRRPATSLPLGLNATPSALLWAYA
jgi:hypothetical protein